MLSNDLAKLATLQSKRFNSDFKVLGMIGKGGFSKVYKVSNILDKNIYAIKKIDLKITDLKDNLERTMERVQRGSQFISKSSFLEARYLSRLSHAKIIRYFNSWVEVEEKKSIVPKKQRDCIIDRIPESNRDLFFDSPQVSKNDLDNLIVFEAKNDTGQISYSEIDEEEINQKKINKRITRKNEKKGGRISMNENKSNSYDCSDTPIQKSINKIVFYIQTEICTETLEIYLQSRDSHLSRSRKKDQQEYSQLLTKFELEAKTILSQIIQGLEYLHNHCKLVHRDLKPGNIFMNSPDDVKIGDFGLVTKIFGMIEKCEDNLVSPNVSNNHCTKMYASPEQMNQTAFDQRSDIYALGLIILQLFHPMVTSMEIMNKMQDARKGVLPQILIDNHPKIAELILDCLNTDPKLRPNISKIPEYLINQQIGSPHASYRSGSTEDSPMRVIGNCLVKFEEEEQCLKFLTYNQKQIQIFKSSLHQKAQMIYNINECTFHLDDDKLQIQHNQLVNLQLIHEGDKQFNSIYNDLIQHNL